MIKYSQSKKYKHIIWDWNGTLLNDGWLFVDIMNSILSKRKMSNITLQKYRQIFEFPVKNYYSKLGFNVKNQSFEKFGIEFIRKYSSRRYEASLYPNVSDLLNNLKIKGISHSILSAQHQYFLNDLTKYYQIEHYFDNIIGLDNHYAYSKIQKGISYIKKINFEFNCILMIGDTRHDFDVAKALGIDCILISHGHNSIAQLKKTKATIFNNLDDIKLFFQI